MDRAKEERLEAAGWHTVTVAEFLELTPAEVQFIELKLRLADYLRRLRAERTQAVVARLIGSSQSRVAKMEAADPGVSLDLMVRASFTLGATAADLALELAPSA